MPFRKGIFCYSISTSNSNPIRRVDSGRFTRRSFYLRYRNTLIQIHILNRVRDFHTARHRALKSFESP